MKNKFFLFFFLALILVSFAFGNILYSDYLNPLTYSIADARYCLKGGSCSLSVTGTGTTILASNSMKEITTWNISESESDVYTFQVYDNVIITPIGGKII